MISIYSVVLSLSLGMLAGAQDLISLTYDSIGRSNLVVLS